MQATQTHLTQQLGGYLHPAYAASLAEFGRPRELPRCGGWILERQIPGRTDYDAMGSYPLFTCRDWSRLHLDLADLGPELVSLAVVTDPFGDYDEAGLRRCFPDVVMPFKEHFLVDLSRPLDTILSGKIRYQVRKAFRAVTVEFCPEPMAFLDEWVTLYQGASQRFKISSVRAFSRVAFAKMFHVPGLRVYRAAHEGQTIGMALVMVQGEIAFGHLIAMNDLGYRLDASYALYWYQIDQLASHCRWLDLGGVPGAAKNGGPTERSGLRAYKAHWATDTRTAYFCGRIFDPARYAAIVQAQGLGPTRYFPAYRQGEFG